MFHALETPTVQQALPLQVGMALPLACYGLLVQRAILFRI